MRNFSLLMYVCSIQFAFCQSKVTSNLEIIDIKNGKRQIIQKGMTLMESPNWSRDGKFFIVNRKGALEKISLKGELLGIINTDFANRCNNAHGISYDGKSVFLVITILGQELPTIHEFLKYPLKEELLPYSRKNRLRFGTG